MGGTKVEARENPSKKYGSLPKTVLLFWSVLLLVHQSPPLICAAAASPAATAVSDAVRRRCIGQFFASYSTSGDVDDDGQNDRNQNGSILNWLKENTSCDLPSEPSVSSYPSWKRKKKDLEMSDGSGNALSSTTATFDDQDRPYHVVILLMENHPIHHEIVTVSSGFLVAGLEVTIFYIFHDDDTLKTNHKNQMLADSIQSEIFERMPPDDSIIQHAQDSFRLIKLNLNKYTKMAESRENSYSYSYNYNYNYTSNLKELDDCRNKIAAAHPLDKCTIQIAPAVLKLLLEETHAHIKPRTIGRTNSDATDRIADEDVGKDDTHKFDFVMMMDASFLGGLLFSEIKMIPTVAIGSDQTLMLAIEHEPKWNPSPKRMTLDRMDRIFLQRLYSLGLTGVFLRANQMRHSLGLKRLKSPLDYYLPVVAMLVDLVPVGDTSIDTRTHSKSGSPESYGSDDFHIGGQSYGYRVHNLQPLVSPCIPCLDQRSSQKLKINSFAIMVAPQAGVTAKWTRSLIRALSLTKQSLEGYDDCLFDRATCRNGVVGFEVNWLSTGEEVNDHFPPVFPSFIHSEVSVNLLDSAIQNPNTMIALIHCDSESNVLTTMGVEVFCISQSNRIPEMYSVGDLLHEKGYKGVVNGIDLAKDRDSPSQLLQESISRETINPEEVATQLLSVLRRKSLGSETSIIAEQMRSFEERNKEVANLVTSGLQRTVAVVKSAAQLHRENIWENPRQMQRETSSAISKALNSMDFQGENIFQVNDEVQDFGGKQDLFDIFTVFIAWLVLLSATVYIIVKDSVVITRWRQYRHHHYYKNGGNIIDSILFRLNDLDDAWDMLSSWASDSFAAKPDFNTQDDRSGRSGSNENAASSSRKEHQLQHNHNNHHHGQIRRRRKMKTTR